MGNAHLFHGPDYGKTFAEARGISRDHERSGGIDNPRRVELSAGTVLIRLFTRLDADKAFGDWWNTPHEIRNVLEHLGINDANLGALGLFQVMLGLLPWWNDADVFNVVELRRPLYAFHGGGAEAVGRRRVLGEIVRKPGLIVDRNGQQRGVRQLFVPEFRTSGEFTILACGLPVAGNLASVARRYDSGPALFEC
jgi:hypothetical protein